MVKESIDGVYKRIAEEQSAKSASNSPVQIISARFVKKEYSSMSPIIVDDEILIKIGFQQIDGQPSKWKYRGFELQQVNTGYHFFRNEAIGPIILYLHDLQNLFRAITGYDFNLDLS